MASTTLLDRQGRRFGVQETRSGGHCRTTRMFRVESPGKEGTSEGVGTSSTLGFGSRVWNVLSRLEGVP